MPGTWDETMIARIEIDGVVIERTFDGRTTPMKELFADYLPKLGKAKEWMIEIIDPRGKLETLRLASDPEKCSNPIRIV